MTVTRREIQQVGGVPRSVVYLAHWWGRKTCLRNGHALPAGWAFTTPIVCVVCGEVIRHRQQEEV